MGVELVVMVSALEHVGLHGLVVKLAEAPDGKPEAESVTPWVVPELSVRVIVLAPEPLCATEILPELERE